MSRVKKIVKTVQNTEATAKDVVINFHPGFPPPGGKVSHLHNMQEAPNPEGNRAERRAYAKRNRGSKGKGSTK